MALSRQARKARAPRVTIPNQETAVISIDGRRQVAILHRLSINGGSIRPSKPFSTGTLGDIALRTTSGNVASAIQLLSSDGRGVQGFRFLQLDPVTRATLQKTITQLRRQGCGESSRILQLCSDAARWMVEIARTQIA